MQRSPLLPTPPSARRRRRAAIVIVTVGALFAGSVASAQPSRVRVLPAAALESELSPGLPPGTSLVVGDFDRDGIDALVAGPIVFDDLRRGPQPNRSTEVGPTERPTLAVPVYQRYGSVSAVGDFDDDGFEDLVLADPDWAPPADPATGFVQYSQVGLVEVFEGSRTGLGAASPVRLTPVLADGAPSVAGFGHALTVGDFDGDGYDDLAVLDVELILPGRSEPEQMWVFRGSADGLSRGRSQSFEITDAESLTGPLAAADFDGDGRDDLAVGGSIATPAGWVSGAFVLSGGPGGPSPTPSLFVSEDGSWPGEVDDSTSFGRAMATGDLDGDGYGDLVVGNPDDSPGRREFAGSVMLARGGPDGLAPQRAMIVTGGRGVAGRSRAGSAFGAALAVGDIDRDGRDDLVVSAPFRDLPGAVAAGQVHVIPGGRRGVAIARSWVLRRADTGAGTPAAGDLFGGGGGAGPAIDGLVLGRLDRGRALDVVIAIPGDRSGEGSLVVVTQLAARGPR